jgi:hypothetical protein
MQGVDPPSAPKNSGVAFIPLTAFVSKAQTPGWQHGDAFQLALRWPSRPGESSFCGQLSGELCCIWDIQFNDP